MEAFEALLPLILGLFAFEFGMAFVTALFHTAVYYLTLALPDLEIAGLAGLCLYVLSRLYRKREAIARWYYFTFHPHPAEPVVRRALKRHVALDGRALAAALGEAPPRSRILREVRLEQGEFLVAEMRRASERMIRKNLRSARSDAERAAFLGIQESLALAAVALERAKAAHKASKSL